MDFQYLKKTAGYVLTAAVSIMIIVYILFHLFGEYDTGLETVAAEYVTMEQSLTVEACILREESVIYAMTEGSTNYLYSDGERVSAGSTVAQIYADNSIGGELIDIDKKITVLEKSSFSDVIALSDTVTIDSNIDSVYYSILDKTGKGDFDSAISQSDDLLVLLNKRALITQNVQSYADKIALLRQRRDELSASAGEFVESVTTQSSGYFYSQTDGFEGIYSSSKVDELQLSDFDVICNSVSNSSLYSDGTRHAVGKVVTDYNWYIACTVSKAEYRAVSSELTSFDIIFPVNNDKTIKTKLVRVVNPADDDRVLLVFRSDMLLDGFDYTRRQTVEIKTAEYSGYKVPVSAVRLENGIKGVYILDSSTVRFREINPLFEKDGWIVCEEKDLTDENQKNRLSLYDFVITEGKDLYDGKVLS